MPNFDKTGPWGQGPMTGGRRGRCRNDQQTQIEKTGSQNSEDNEVIYGLGRGGRPCGGGRQGNHNFGRGFRGGRGCGRRYGDEQ